MGISNPIFRLRSNIVGSEEEKQSVSTDYTTAAELYGMDQATFWPFWDFVWF